MWLFVNSAEEYCSYCCDTLEYSINSYIRFRLSEREWKSKSIRVRTLANLVDWHCCDVAMGIPASIFLYLSGM